MLYLKIVYVVVSTVKKGVLDSWLSFVPGEYHGVLKLKHTNMLQCDETCDVCF